MRTFNYTAQGADGKVSSGIVSGADETEAVEALQSKGLIILAIKEGAGGLGGLGNLRAFVSGSVSGREMVFFGEQMSTLLAGGIPIVRALTLLSGRSDNPRLAYVVGDLAKKVSAGEPLHKALARHPDVFDDIWVSLVEAGEMSGQLPAVLRQVTAYCESKENVKSKIISALSYPAALFALAVGVLWYFMVYIIPVFAGIFRDFNLQLPLLTRVITGISGIASAYAVLLAVLAVCGFIGFRFYISTTPGRLSWNYVLFRMPVFGQFLLDIQTERLLTTMLTLLRSGVGILSTLSVLEGVFRRNLVFSGGLQRVAGEISGGRSISDAFANSGLVQPLVTDMLRMGEESGKVTDMLAVLSKYYQEQIDQFIRRFSAMIDPILIVGVGCIVGVILISIFMPIFQLSNISG